MTDSLLLGDSREMTILRLQCPRFARWHGTLVIVGATGTGKGLLVEELRRHLPPGMPFARLAATTSRHALLYTALFGHLKGTFTGAERDVRGVLASLHGGVLFLDDFQDVSEEFQHYLVEIADGKPVFQLGAERPMPTHVRLVIGTQVPLESLWRQGRLREDLFERLNGVTAVLPPLAERREDIPALAAGLLQRLAARERREACSVRQDALALLTAHNWPRNVRELERTLERAAFSAWTDPAREPRIGPIHLEEAGLPTATRGRGRRVGIPAALVLDRFNALGSTRATAEATGLTLRTVQRVLHRSRLQSGE